MKLIFLILTVGSVAFCESTKNKLEKFVTDEIVPDVISKVPQKVLKVTFDGLEVDFGNELTPTQVKNTPKLSWEAEKDAFYTLSMVDPDGLSRQNPIYREVNHWLVGNIPGNDVASGDVITEFLSSGPPKDTGLHRYVLLVYKQPKKLEFDHPRTAAFSRNERFHFHIAEFAKKNGLGDPLAGNYYQAQYDSYVDVRNKLIKS